MARVLPCFYCGAEDDDTFRRRSTLHGDEPAMVGIYVVPGQTVVECEARKQCERRCGGAKARMIRRQPED